MRIGRKIATSSPTGKLRLTDDGFEEIHWESIDEIESMPDGVDKLQMYLKFANFCNETFMDREARHYYEFVLKNVIQDGIVINGLEDLAEQAYQGLISLSHSDDEYVWETVSDTLEQYRHLFERKGEGLSD